MELRLGRDVFDVSTRALVVSDNIDDRAAALFVPDSPDLVSTVTTYAAASERPIVAQTSDGQTADACLRAGASVIDGGILSDPHLLPAIADANGSVWISGAASVEVAIERARWAEASGIAMSQIIIEAHADQVAQLSTVGYPIAVATSHDDPGAQGTHVAAMMNGARIIRSNSTQATKRTLFTVGELLERRGVASPEAAVAIGTA